jgi:phenylpropionate dioxygenase-like ring-hydroxylating dioxygenase large terminal subunit
MLKNFWYACEWSSAIASKPKRITLMNQDFVLYRNTHSQVVALNDFCAHRGAGLSQGQVEKDCIRCPYHGWKYREDGVCIEIPANEPDIPIPQKARVQSYFVREKYGFIWLFWGNLPEEELPPLPSLPEVPNTSWRSVDIELKFNAHYTRVLENLTDPVHVAFIHRKSFGNGIAKHPQFLVSKDEVLLDDWGGSILLSAKQPAPENGLFWNYIYSKNQGNVNIKSAFYLPNIAVVSIGTKFKFLQYFCLVPVDQNTTLVKYIQFRNFLTYFWADSLFRTVNLKLLQEDRLVVESQCPKVVPEDLAAEIHVAGDALSVAYRRLRKKYLDCQS